MEDIPLDTVQENLNIPSQHFCVFLRDQKNGFFLSISSFFLLELSSTPPDSQGFVFGPVDPTQGFLSLPLNRSYYHIQQPYDVPEDQRYSFINGVHKCWVYSTDKPHTPTSQTEPRTEIAIQGYNYSPGVWQFEGYGYVPDGTSGVCIMQVFGASHPHATTLMLRVYNGSLMYYRGPVLVPHIYNRWFRLNVIHDVDATKVKVYIDGHLKFEAPGRGGTSHAFKCGVYAQDDDSHCMESRWKDIKISRKSC